MPPPPPGGIGGRCPSAFAPFIRSLRARLLAREAPHPREAPRSGAGAGAGSDAGADGGASSNAATPADPEGHQGADLAFFDTTVAKWKDGAGSTAAGCMLRFMNEKRRSWEDILQAAAHVKTAIDKSPPPRRRTPRVARVLAMATGHLSTAVQLVLEARHFVHIAQTTKCELTTECLLNSSVVRQAFMHFPDAICGFVQPPQARPVARASSLPSLCGWFVLVQELPVEACSVSHNCFRRQ